MDSFQIAFRDASGVWLDNLQPVALWLLVTLATISIAWRFVQVVIQGGRVELGEILMEVIRFVMLVGGVAFLIENAPALTGLMLDSAADLAGQATGTSQALRPNAILTAGVSVAEQLMVAASPLTLLFAALAGFLIVGLYAGIAAFILVTYIEFYVISAAGIWTLGLAAAPWTSDIAKHYIRGIAATAVKLYVLYLIVGIGLDLVGAWVITPDQINYGEVFMVFSVVLVLFVMTFMLPAILAGIVAGSSVGAMAPLAMMQTAMQGAAAMTAMAVRGGAAAHAAGGLAGAQMGATSLGGAVRAAVAAAPAAPGSVQPSRGTALAAGAGAVGEYAGKTATNLAAGLFGNVKGRIVGQGSTAGTIEGMRETFLAGSGAGATTPRGGVEGTITPGKGGD